ncbi:carbohydrate-binding module family 19 protein [Mucor lusitanicus CBS 277.49]|uniref:chitinase n=1 Tax=Mucor lusitanicus CBS 277.49 TaxID=747725 RepID=A0A162QKD2_MUCCL|nr:carbohydrate-binding module family 19 protein [Mucor lusitanicus CBS 277.49]
MLRHCKFVNLATAATAIATLLAVSSTVHAGGSFLDKPSVVTYWGQNSKGSLDSQKSLASYCDDNSDVLIMSFVLDFSDGSLPMLNLANGCSGPAFSGTELLQCTSVEADIKTCQDRGKTILMSLGGANGVYGFANDADAESFADTLWNIFGAGESDTRPFGDAIIDGFDLDIEGGGSTGYVAMIKQLRKHFATDSSKDYYITGAPQCPYPDAMLGTVLDAVEFDAVNVQFYNNYCAATSSSFNFDTWNAWATKSSPNPDVKVFLGLPGSSAAAGSGYVAFDSLEPIVKELQSSYSNFGGVTLWDASASYDNTDVSPNYQAAVADLHSTSTKSKSTTSKPKPTKTLTSTSESNTAGSPTSCVSHASKCPTEGQMVCSGDSFATCNHGKWEIRQCPSSLTCFSTTDGSSIYCGQGTGGTICPAALKKSQQLVQGATFLAANTKQKASSSSFYVGPTAKPYKNGRVIAQFSVTKVNAGAGSFEAVINARRFDQTSFGNTVVVSFKVANGIKITGVTGGTVSQTGSQVRIQYKNRSRKTMVAIVGIKGEVSTGNVLVAPNVNSMKFSS